MDTPQIDNSAVDTSLESHRAPHEHGWSARSAHPTSDGTVLYVRCVSCGAQRVDLQSLPSVPPRALSVALPGDA